jgi:hypothetical protein
MGLSSKEQNLEDAAQTLVSIIKHYQQHILKRTGKSSEQTDLFCKG